MVPSSGERLAGAAGNYAVGDRRLGMALRRPELPRRAFVDAAWAVRRSSPAWSYREPSLALDASSDTPKPRGMALDLCARAAELPLGAELLRGEEGREAVFDSCRLQARGVQRRQRAIQLVDHEAVVLSRALAASSRVGALHPRPTETQNGLSRLSRACAPRSSAFASVPSNLHGLPSPKRGCSDRNPTSSVSPRATGVTTRCRIKDGLALLKYLQIAKEMAMGSVGLEPTTSCV
jgi:hypothetical protein